MPEERCLVEGGAIRQADHSRARFCDLRNPAVLFVDCCRVTDPAGLVSNNISAITQTRNGVMWIGTAETGLARFEPSTGHFTYYRNVPSNPASLSGNRIMSLYADQDGTLWVGTVNSGLNHFDPSTGKFERYRHDSADPASLIDDEVTTILRDSGGLLWVATMAGLSRLDPDQQGFVNYSGLTGRDSSGFPVSLWFSSLSHPPGGCGIMLPNADKGYSLISFH